MLDKDGVDVTADGGVTVTEDAGDAFELRPYAVLDVDRMTLHQLRRSEIGSLEIGVIRFQGCLPMRCCLGDSDVSVTTVASVAVSSLPNRLSVLAGEVLLTALSLFTALRGLVVLSDFIIKSGLGVVDTLDSGASVNSVDLDAVDLFVFIGKCVFGETLICEILIQVVELGV